MSYIDSRTESVRPAEFFPNASWVSSSTLAPYSNPLHRGLFWALTMAVSFWAFVAAMIWAL